MANVVGDVAVSVGADVSPLAREMGKAGKHLDSFGTRAAAMAKRMSVMGAAITAAAAATGLGLYKIAQSAATLGADIERLSRVAQATPEAFQRMSYAAAQVGIQQEKLADILLTVQDRVGDFLQTGGGPMKDFFEKIAPLVGVTAEQFRNLSGPDALQLYYNSLQRANLTQPEMVFYLEKMASDLSLLQPLLADNGKEFERLGEKAEAAGLVLSNDAVKGATALKAELDALGKQISTQFAKAILENKEDIIELVDQINTVWIPALVKLAGAITGVINAFSDPNSNLVRFVRNLNSAVEIGTRLPRAILDAPGALGRSIGEGVGGLVRPAPEPSELEGLIFGGGRDNLGGGAGQDRLTGAGGMDSLRGGLLVTPAEGLGGDIQDYLDQITEVNELALEIEAQANAARLTGLQEYTAQKKDIVAAAHEEELAGAQAHAEALAEVERLSAEEKLRHISGAMGDLATLMQAGNEKLFRIGQASAIAQAIVDGYSAAVSAWEKGMKVGGPGVAAAFTAASLARTGALISSIASQSPRGGGAAPAAGGGGGGGTPQTPLSVRLQGISPGDLITGAQLGSLLDRLNDEAGDRGFRLLVAQ